MAIINPEFLAMARVQVGQLDASYLFSNGFDSTEVKGASMGAPVIARASASAVVLFLTEPTSPGKINGVNSSEAGIKARVDIVGISTPSSPVPLVSPTVEARWFYGDYAPSALLPLGNYDNVDPQKMIVVDFFQYGSLDHNTGPKVFDIAVFRNPMTRYKPPVIYGILPNVIVTPAP